MNLFKNYIEYLKDNPEGYWFKRKLYGWGWVPAKWQGWFFMFVFAIFFIFGVTETNVVLTILPVIALIFICYKKGEKPRWQWGKKN